VSKKNFPDFPKSDDSYASLPGVRQTLVRVNGGPILKVPEATPWEDVLKYVERKFCGRDSEA
jgi:hypothetical protein